MTSKCSKFQFTIYTFLCSFLYHHLFFLPPYDLVVLTMVALTYAYVDMSMVQLEKVIEWICRILIFTILIGSFTFPNSFYMYINWLHITALLITRVIVMQTLKKQIRGVYFFVTVHCLFQNKSMEPFFCQFVNWQFGGI